MIEIEKLRGGDGSSIERLQAILHADVVERPTGESRLGIEAVGIALPVEHRRARPGWIADRVVALGNRHIRTPRSGVVARDVDAAGHRIGASCLVGGVVPGLHTFISGNGNLLIAAEAVRIGHGEVVREQVAIHP